MKKLICYLVLVLAAGLSGPALAEEDNPFAAPRFLVAEFKKFMSDMVGERFMRRLPVSVGKQQGLPAGALTDAQIRQVLTELDGINRRVGERVDEIVRAHPGIASAAWSGVHAYTPALEPANVAWARDTTDYLIESAPLRSMLTVMWSLAPQKVRTRQWNEPGYDDVYGLWEAEFFNPRHVFNSKVEMALAPAYFDMEKLKRMEDKSSSVIRGRMSKPTFPSGKLFATEMRLQDQLIGELRPFFVTQVDPAINKLAARVFCVAIEKKPGTACGFQS
jgi:hypothetical protein